METVAHGIQVTATILQVRTPVERDGYLEAELEQDTELYDVVFCRKPREVCFFTENDSLCV